MKTTLVSPLRRALIGATLAVGAVPPALAIAASGIAPDFTLRSAAGPNLRLHEQRGNVVMVNFWATWCGPCRQELPHLNRIYEKYRASGFVLLGVNIDADPRLAVSMAERMGLKFPLLLDGDKKVGKLYELSSMPSTVVIDRDGRVRHVHLGYQDGLEVTYDKQVRELVKE
jgi:peroxiredoxin